MGEGHRLENRSFYRRFTVLVLPIAIQNLMSALVSASDALMLGMLDQSSLSAVSLATQVQFVLNLFIAALTIGATILAAQYWGRQKPEMVEHVLGIALRLGIVISAVFFLAGMLCPGLLMRIFTNDQELIALGIPYLRIVSGSYICTTVSQIYLCIMKNTGRTLRSTIYGSAALVLNLILNMLLIFGFGKVRGLGIQGAAYATLIARVTELGIVLLENTRKKVVRIRFKCMKSPLDYLKKDFYHYMSPVLVNELVWGCGLAAVSAVMGHMGSDAVAAHSIAGIVKNIIACVCLGIGTGSGIVIGNELGSGRLEQAKRYGDKLCHVAIITGFISGFLIFGGIPLIESLAGNLTEQAHIYLRFMLYICSYYMIGKSVNSSVIGGIFCSGGDTRFGMLCDAVTMWGIVVPIGAAAAFILKLPVPAVYFIVNLDEMIKLPAVYRHYKKYKWVRDLTREETEDDKY